jgi:hypothetical protein
LAMYWASCTTRTILKFWSLRKNTRMQGKPVCKLKIDYIEIRETTNENCGACAETRLRKERACECGVVRPIRTTRAPSLAGRLSTSLFYYPPDRSSSSINNRQCINAFY